MCVKKSRSSCFFKYRYIRKEIQKAKNIHIIQPSNPYNKCVMKPTKKIKINETPEKNFLSIIISIIYYTLLKMT